ncbi:toxin-antitoxin system YwqK family antitoxin [Larkinella bovis]|uniref:Toxin-antitoxin system YwqK family antitoxin n=1 Tax=Larkinella bovis TaxID=683041 RepID=A0ABW0I6A5_9BACT
MNGFCLLLLSSLLVIQPDDGAKKNRRPKNRVERKAFQDSYAEITYHDRWEKVVTVRFFDPENHRISEEHFSNYPLRIRHGRASAWYPNGQLRWACDFKNNQINGPYFSYFEDGTLKRRELYRQGVARKGECFTPDGTPTACNPLVQQAEFDGNQKQFIQFMKERLPRIPSTEPTLFITLKGTLSEEGILFGLRPMPYMAQRPQSEKDLARQLIESLHDMPRWRPLIIDDQPIQSDLLISIQFSNGKVFNASYGINLL